MKMPKKSITGKSKTLKLFSFVALFTAFLTIYQITPLANANANASTTETTVEIGQEPISLLQEEYNAADFEETTLEVETVENDSLTDPRGVQESENLNLAPGKSWSRSFQVNNMINADHNAFNTKISNLTSGTYKVIITSLDGYKYASPEFSSGTTLTTSNAVKYDAYTVTIVNTSASNLKATVNITSYIK